jgi:ubiquinol-cytochrome c reductase cytochrome b subunit
LMALHQHGSNNPTGIDVKGPQDQIPFHPYYTSKDFFGFGVFFLVFAAFIFFAPNYLGHPDNYLPADPLVTPKHIVPEWYFLPYYAILRAITFDIPLWIPGIGALGLAFVLKYSALVRALIGGSKLGVIAVSFLPKKPCGMAAIGGLLAIGAIMTITGLAGAVIESKLAGVLAMFGSILILFLLPWLDTSPVRSSNYRPMYKWFFWLFAINAVVLGYCGSKPPEGIFPLLSLVCTGYYFAHFLLVLPIVGRIEKPRKLPESISAAVLAKQKTAHH